MPALLSPILHYKISVLTHRILLSTALLYSYNSQMHSIFLSSNPYPILTDVSISINHLDSHPHNPFLLFLLSIFYRKNQYFSRLHIQDIFRHLAIIFL
jgi:hypothetical protein